MIAQGQGRSPMTSSDAETDFKLIIIDITIKVLYKPNQSAKWEKVDLN